MRSLEQLDSWISTKVRTWSAKLSGGPQTAELLEIRREILSDIRDHIQPKGDGKSVFPYNTISIRVAARDGTQMKLIEGAFAEDEELEQTILALLMEARCPVPAGMRVSVTGSEDPALAASNRPFRIEYSRIKASPAGEETKGRPPAKLVVIQGQADATEFAIRSDRVNLGRLKEILSDKGGLVRRNDLAFDESETTVSREHAFIRYDPGSKKFRLYDSMSQRGTSVFRPLGLRG